VHPVNVKHDVRCVTGIKVRVGRQKSPERKILIYGYKFTVIG